MKLLIPALAVAMTAAIAFTACEETTTIGSSLIQDETSVSIDSLITIDGATVSSIPNDSVQSRTITQLLGRLEAKGYGTLESNVVTQFMPSNVMDTTGVVIDSVKLRLAIQAGGFIGDSLVPMGLEVYQLDKRLLSQPIFANTPSTDFYNPATSKRLGSRIYSASAIGESDSLAELSYRFIYVDLDKQLGEDLLAKYKDPATRNLFYNPEDFAKNIFPGVAITNTYGSGRILQIIATEIKTFYSQTLPKDDNSGTDTTYSKVGTYLAVTPEVVTNNNITLTISEDIRKMIDNDEAIVVAPAGYDVEFDFPARTILEKYETQTDRFAVINTLSLEIPASAIANDYGIEPPEYLLMVLEKDKYSFFNDNKITDGKTSFYATYNSTTGMYTFSGMRQYLIDLLNKGISNITDSDIRFIITPVTISMETNSSYGSSTYISEISPLVTSPAMVKLDLTNAKIRFVFSKQMIKK